MWSKNFVCYLHLNTVCRLSFSTRELYLCFCLWCIKTRWFIPAKLKQSRLHLLSLFFSLRIKLWMRSKIVLKGYFRKRVFCGRAVGGFLALLVSGFGCKRPRSWTGRNAKRSKTCSHVAAQISCLLAHFDQRKKCNFKFLIGENYLLQPHCDLSLNTRQRCPTTTVTSVSWMTPKKSRSSKESELVTR